MHISILGIDNGKNSRSVVGVDDRGAAVVRRTMRRQSLIEFVQKLCQPALPQWKLAVSSRMLSILISNVQDVCKDLRPQKAKNVRR